MSTSCGSVFFAFVLGWLLNTLVCGAILGVIVLPEWLYRRRQRRKVH